MAEPLIIPSQPLPADSVGYDLSLMVCPEPEQPLPVVETPPPPPAWLDGKSGEPRQVYAGDNSGVLLVVAGMLLTMMLSFRSCRHLFGILFQELLGVRRRENAFDEHTSNEARRLLLMAVQWSICTGFLLYSSLAATLALPASRALSDSMICVGITAVYYAVQYCAYWLVGYTFGTPDGRRVFLQGFTASQSLLGFALIIPALASIFYPSFASAMVECGAALYLLARIVFIIKGFRIFYHNFPSLLYFILYLCTLEIIPIFWIYEIARSLLTYSA